MSATADPARPMPALLRAGLWMGLSLFCISGMAISGRMLSGHYSTWQILFYRGLVGLVVIGALAPRLGFWRLKSRQLPLHFARAVIHFSGQYGWFVAITVLPLAEVFALEFTTPIWTTLLAPLLLGERLTGRKLTAVFIGFAGILVLLRPGLALVNLMSLVMIGAAITFAITHICTKRITRTDDSLSVVFYMLLFQTPLALVGALPHWQWPTLATLPWIVAVGLTALTAHYAISKALTAADASVVVPMDFLRLPLIAVVGWALYGEELSFWLVIGAALICLGTWINTRPARAADPEPAAATAVNGPDG
ncbi:DMT family transporter [Radicibacter daui]|uniref:DMT family transporter n=1 Tax=Radicibacter daui TaxID=3064829 RepID=UPI004046E75B